MILDTYVDNLSISDFTHPKVNYIPPTAIYEDNNGVLYADFKEGLHFTEAHSIYNQFTFILVDDVVVSFKPIYNCEEAAEVQIDCYDTAIVIEEGMVEEVIVINEETGEEIEINWEESERLTAIYGKPTYVFYGCIGNYKIIIKTRNGREYGYDYEVEPKGPYSVELGPDVQYLDSNGELLLDASIAADPDAFYKWYFNDMDLNYYEPILNATQIGNYEVHIKTSDGVCEYKYGVRVVSGLEVEIICNNDGCKPTGSIEVNVSSGVAPFVTVVQGDNNFHQDFLHTESLIIDELPNGQYTISVEDSVGNVFIEECLIELNGYAAMGQFQLSHTTLTQNNPTILLDAQPNLNNYGNYTYTYTWFKDNAPLSETTPQLTVSEPGNYHLEVYIHELDCFGKIEQIIDHKAICFISHGNSCEKHDNYLEVQFDYGFPPYELRITGTNSGNGGTYDRTYMHQGDIILADIPFGEYTVRSTDRYGGYCQETIVFEDVLEGEDIDLQRIVEDDLEIHFCTLHTPHDDYDKYACDCCGSNVDVISTELDGVPYFLIRLDASTYLSNAQDFSFEWFSEGVSLGIYDYEVYFGLRLKSSGYNSTPNELKVVATHKNGCTIESGILAEDYFEIIPYVPIPAPKKTTYNTRVYPNPNRTGSTLYYYVETSSNESFEAEVELISMTGAVVSKQSMRGNTSYNIPFQLITTGTYIIRTTTNDGNVLIDRVIIK